MYMTTALISVNGYESMSNQYMGAAANYTYRDAALHGNRTCGFPPEDSFHIFRSADNPSYPWPGMVFGLTVLALNAWCTDQVSERSPPATSTHTLFIFKHESFIM